MLYSIINIFYCLRWRECETGDKICLDNLDKLDFDLSCILKLKYKFNEEKNYTEMNKGKPIRLGIVKLSDERQNIKSNMLNAADGASTSPENWSKKV